jgi:hypothetical protein
MQVSNRIVQASSLGLGAGVVLGAASMHRQDSAVLVGLSSAILALCVLAPLTDVNAGSLVQLAAGVGVGAVALMVCNGVWGVEQRVKGEGDGRRVYGGRRGVGHFDPNASCAAAQAYFTSPETASAMIAITVPAYVCGLAGGTHAATSSSQNLYPIASALAAISILAGAWGASHDPPIDPDLWLAGAY